MTSCCSRRRGPEASTSQTPAAEIGATEDGVQRDRRERDDRDELERRHPLIRLCDRAGRRFDFLIAAYPQEQPREREREKKIKKGEAVKTRFRDSAPW